MRSLTGLFKQEKGLAFKMILFIFSSIALIFVIIFPYYYVISKKLVEKSLKHNAENLTIATVTKVEKVLTACQTIPYNFAKLVENSDFSEETILKILKHMVENNPELYGATMAFEPGFYTSEEKYHAPYYFKQNGTLKLMYLGDDRYDYFTMDWYQIPKELNRPVWSEPYYDEGAGNVVMSTYSTPIFRMINGSRVFVGILTADISLFWLQEYINSIKVMESGYGFMITTNGSIITHPIKEVIMNETIFSIAEAQESDQLREIGRNMIQGKSSFAEVEYKNLTTGKLSWIAYAPVSLNGWSVGIVFPVNEFMADVNNLTINVLILGLSGLILILIVIITISRSITSPLRALTTAAGKFAQGDFNVVLPDIKSKDEIGKLNNSFIYMKNALATTISDLKEASENLRISNEKLEEYSHTLEIKVEERTLELKEKNQALDEAFKNVRTLNEIGKQITATLDFEAIMIMVYQNVNSLLDASGFLIMIYNESEHKLECKLSIENGERLPPYEVSMEEKNRFPVWCVDHASPVYMNDVENEYMKYVPNRAAPKAGKSVNSLIYFPLMVEKKVLGVISAQSFRKNAYSQYHFDMLSNLANFIAIAFDNALSYEKINKANTELKAAQAQLVQSEKMASLGQLTAGIAHEIKNPLNFVNNFAELTVDLAKELAEEIEKISDRLDANDSDYLMEIMTDIKSNAVKINEHGKRADSIVKGMLLHSRGKAGEMQPTDINALLAEYVNLGYHGMRAQDTGFNLKIDASYDDSIGRINVVPQNISRVFLNIINNACYSTNQKKKEMKDAYFPILSVITKNLDKTVEVRIKDNGKGIPQEILDKIFNPFFTTKPAGQGTGLGLSLSYDIIVQEHKGNLVVESQMGEYAEFIITIPKNLS